MTLPARASLVVLSLAIMSACATTQARTPVPPPALDTPEPPPRLILRTPEPEPPAEPPPSAATSPPAPVKPTRDTPPARQTDKPTSPPAQTSPPPTEPAPVLQTTDTAELEQKTRGLIDQANRDLKRLKFESLGRGAREQYNTAMRFVQMAFEAIKQKNYVYARQLADNAAALAAQLVKGY